MSKHAYKLSRLTRASRTASVLLIVGLLMIALAEDNPALAGAGILTLILSVWIYSAADFSAAAPKAEEK